MVTTTSASRWATRASVGLDKARWGARTVGWGGVAAGAIRLAALALRRPERVLVQLRDFDMSLGFAYPSQLVPALVVFRSLIDPEYPFLAAVARPGWTFLDVGAAIGQFTVFAAAAAGGRVHAFEPSAANLATLRANVAQNGVGERVSIHRLALSNRAGEAEFSTAPNAFMSRLDAASPLPAERVPVEPLADAAARLGIDRVSVLKVNVAGFEPQVLEGARPLLARGGADVLVLLLGRQSYDSYRELAALGYRFFFFHPGERRLHEVERFDDETLVRSRPWPARHLLGIWAESVDKVLDGAIGIVPARARIPQG
jgi:FkbM family methyltransferase